MVRVRMISNRHGTYVQLANNVFQCCSGCLQLCLLGSVGVMALVAQLSNQDVVERAFPVLELAAS